jgi:uncharacterized membrane protein (UPF0127 family)
MRVINLTRNTILAETADSADTSAKRRTGLLKHDCLRKGEGLWIAPCEAVHTFGMKFPIDVVYLSRKKRVLKIRPGMKQGRVSACLRAYSVLELPAGMAAESATSVGDQLTFER